MSEVGRTCSPVLHERMLSIATFMKDRGTNVRLGLCLSVCGGSREGAELQGEGKGKEVGGMSNNAWGRVRDTTSPIAAIIEP